MTRLFWRGLFLIGAVFFAIVLIGPIFTPQGLASIQPESVLNWYINRIIDLLSLSWIIAVLLCLAMYATWPFATRDDIPDDAAGQRAFFPPVCSGMMLLWMLFVTGFWLGLGRMLEGLSTRVMPSGGADHSHEPAGFMFRTQGPNGMSLFEETLQRATATLPEAAFGLVLLIVAGIFVFSGRRKYTATPPSVIKGENDQDKAKRLMRSRLILNRRFQWVFCISTLLVFLKMIYVWKMGFVCGNGPGFVLLAFFGQNIQCSQNVLVIATGIVLFLAFTVYYFSGAVGAGLGVARDVIMLLVRMKYAHAPAENENRFLASTTTDLATRRKHSRDAAQEDRAMYPRRMAIEDRFEIVLRHMIDQERPAKITLITHSLGTVIATRVLRRLDLCCDLCPGIKPTLFTMGSPVTHLHRQYFPVDFAVPPKDFAALKWYNLYRPDDFVGTTVDIKGDNFEVDNCQIYKGGHPEYFVDDQLWAYVDRKIGLRLA